MPDLTVRGQLEEALRWVRACRPQESIRVCRRILQTYPRHVGTYSVLGQALLQLDRMEQAADLFHRVLSVDPEHAIAYVSLAHIYRKQGAPDEALFHLERALELTPADSSTRADLRLVRGQFVGIEPRRIKMTRATLARAYLRGQLFSKAIAELDRALALEGQRFDLLVAQAEALWLDERIRDCEALCQTILQDLPECLKANLLLGHVWLNTVRDEQARRLLQRAQSADPENAVAQTLFGSSSPLLPRIARLPVLPSEVPPLDLPYLVDDEETIEQYLVIEGQSEDSDAEDPSHEVVQVVDDGPTVEQGPAIQAEEEGQSQESETAPGPAGMTLLDIRRQYVEEHPDDYQARLDLARRLRDLWRIEQALEHYGILVQQQYEALPAVLADLERLDRLYPGTPELVALLGAARARERKSVE